MEKIKEAFNVALSNLSVNKVRSMLSIMGIVIGIASVVTILAVSAGARAQIIERVNALGVNLYYIYPEFNQKTKRIGKLELRDITNIQRLPFVQTAFPRLSLSKQVRTRMGEIRCTLKGVNEFFIKSQNLLIKSGRNFSPIEIEERSFVGILHEDAVVDLFQDQDPLNKKIYIDGRPWTIIGIFGTKQQKKKYYRKRLPKKDFLVPLTTVLRNEKNVHISGIEIHVTPNYKGKAIEELTTLMERGDSNRKSLFRVWDQQEYLQKRLEIDRTLSSMVVLVASISLIVGGIGMMNVMLTSVAERTREIGLRRALGAKRKDILRQFLVESCVLSGLGGFLGLFFGTALARGIPMVFQDFVKADPQIKPLFLLISVGCASILGVIFGLYPAIKASQLSAAEALRSE